MKFEEEIMKAQRSQELNMNLSIEGTDENTFMKSFQETLYESYDRESFEKAWSKDLQSKFPSGGWRTINGAKVFINNGKVIAGLDGFNGAIDKFFEEKKGKSEGKGSSKLQERTDKLLKEYYEKDKGIKEKVVKRGVAESTAKIDAKKRGSEFSVKPDENEKGKFKVVHNVKGDAEGLSFEQYKDKYGDQLSVTAKNQIDYEDKNEGKNSDSKSISKDSLEKIKKDAKNMSVDELRNKIEEIEKITDSEKTSGSDRVDYMSAQIKLMSALASKAAKGEKSSGNKEITLDTFKDIAKQSKNVEEFIDKVQKVKNVPPEVSEEFKEKYGKNKTIHEAALRFLKEHNKDLAKGQPDEARTKITQEEKDYYQKHKDEIKKIIDDDPLTSIRDAVKEHKEGSNKKDKMSSEEKDKNERDIVFNNFKSKILSHKSSNDEFTHQKKLLDNTLHGSLELFASRKEINQFNKLKGTDFNKDNIKKQLEIIERLNNRLQGNSKNSKD
jgi:hypothetical protein